MARLCKNCSEQDFFGSMLPIVGLAEPFIPKTAFFGNKLPAKHDLYSKGSEQ